MSRRWIVAGTVWLALSAAPPAMTQDEDDPVNLEPDYGPPSEDCSRDQEAASISGEIVVCRRLLDQSEHRLRQPSEAEQRYAKATAYAGDIQPPNVDGPGIFTGEPTVSGLCIPGLQKCPPPPAYMIDFDELPEAPPGSDADRIARGLPPLGQDTPTTAARPPASRSATPPISASPAEAPSD